MAVVEEERRRLRLHYTEAALSRYDLGTPLLSLTLPLQPERHTQGVVKPFLDGLLPEGPSGGPLSGGPVTLKAFGDLRQKSADQLKRSRPQPLEKRDEFFDDDSD